MHLVRINGSKNRSPASGWLLTSEDDRTYELQKDYTEYPNWQQFTILPSEAG